MCLWLWWITCIHVEAESDTLKPGDTVNYTGKLYSTKGTYYLCFDSLFDSDDNQYLFIMNANNYVDVWMSDENQPTQKDSAVLSLNHSGVLKIESQRGNPIILYSPPQPINNTVATLLDTGNFVLQQLHPNGTNTIFGRVLMIPLTIWPPPRS